MTSEVPSASDKLGSSVDSIPSSAGKEDHVSMGSISSRKLAQVVEHVRTVLGIEAMVAAQGLDLREPLTPARGVAAAHRAVRGRIPRLTEDRPLYLDMEGVAALIAEGAMLRAVQDEIGALQ